MSANVSKGLLLPISVTANLLIELILSSNAIGHSFLPNDQDFSCIESRLKRTKLVYTPGDMEEIIGKAKAKSFTVVKMDHEDFHSVEALKSCIVKRKLDDKGFPVNWLRIQRLRFTVSDPFAIYFSESVTGDVYRRLDCQRVRKGRPSHPGTCVLTALYNIQPRRLPAAKVKDIRKLMKYVPAADQGFYNAVIRDGFVGDQTSDIDYSESEFGDNE